MDIMLDPAVQYRPPAWLRWIGFRWRDGRRSYRMRWGELSFRPGLALELCLFSEHYSLRIHALIVNAYVHLPFLQRWHREPFEIMESWGAATFETTAHLHWGRHTTIVSFPWGDWVQTAHQVRRADGSWVPYVGSWERDKDPDGREERVYPYRYLRQSGEVQQRTATIYVERRTRTLRWLRRLPWGKTTYAINVAFSDEVGERSGSWKGGTVGCSYKLSEDETPRECLKRMERDRRFT